MRRIILSNRRFCIFGCIIFLVVSLNFNHHQVIPKKSSIINNNLSINNNILKQLRKHYIVIPDKVITEEVKIIAPEVIKLSKSITFVVSAYDLSVTSTGKSRGNSSFGLTKSGISLKGHNWRSIRIVASDPRVVPIGTKLLIKFTDAKHQKYNEVYTSADSGSAIRGNRLDLFIEDGNGKVSKEALEFGIAHASVTIIKE